jgi:hypothetical protein
MNNWWILGSVSRICARWKAPNPLIPMSPGAAIAADCQLDLFGRHQPHIRAALIPAIHRKYSVDFVLIWFKSRSIGCFEIEGIFVAGRPESLGEFIVCQPQDASALESYWSSNHAN